MLYCATGAPSCSQRNALDKFRRSLGGISAFLSITNTAASCRDSNPTVLSELLQILVFRGFSLLLSHRGFITNPSQTNTPTSNTPLNVTPRRTCTSELYLESMSMESAVKSEKASLEHIRKLQNNPELEGIRTARILGQCCCSAGGSAFFGVFLV